MAAQVRQPGDQASGHPWTREEVALVVADYFSMFEEHLRTGRTDKAAHRSALSRQISRSSKSLEFKHCNISAVLSELGLPWLPGYAPLNHYQRILVDEVEAQFEKVYALANAMMAPVKAAPVLFLDEILVDCPKIPAGSAGSGPLESLVRKFDPAARDARNRALGTAGEEFVVEFERRRLHEAGVRDVDKVVQWTARVQGDGAGFDVQSIDLKTGKPLRIEVKTTRGAKTTPFFLSRNEEEVSREPAHAWQLYRVFNFGESPRLFKLNPPLDKAVNLSTATWAATFR